MADVKNKGGRPPMTEEEKQRRVYDLSQKLEPYLKTGLSISKALSEAKVSKDMFYRLMDADEGFRDRINGFRNFIPILLNNIITGHLMSISAKQNPSKGKQPQMLTKEDVKFLQWFALNSNLTKGEFGERKSIQVFDPEAEIQKVKGIIEASTTEEILHN